MKFLLSLLFVIVSLSAQTVLVINSNSEIEKYNVVIEAFKENFTKPFKIVDISKMQANEIKEYLYSAYPDIVYAVGSKAYKYASAYLPEKKIFFSSIVNWKRLKVKENTYGIANELHSGVELTLIKTIFEKITKIGIIYSKYTQDVYEDLHKNALQMGIEIIAKKITSTKNIKFDKFLQNSEAFIIIPDPILLKSIKTVEKLFTVSQALKKPVFAYDKLFIKYGAVLSISVDNPTIGRQAAVVITKLIRSNEEIQKIQFPMGSSMIFNKKIAQDIGVIFNDKSLTIVNKVIE